MYKFQSPIPKHFLFYNIQNKNNHNKYIYIYLFFCNFFVTSPKRVKSRSDLSSLPSISPHTVPHSAEFPFVRFRCGFWCKGSIFIRSSRRLSDCVCSISRSVALSVDFKILEGRNENHRTDNEKLLVGF